MEDIYYLIHSTDNYDEWPELKTSNVENWDDQFPGADSGKCM